MYIINNIKKIYKPLTLQNKKYQFEKITIGIEPDDSLEVFFEEAKTELYTYDRDTLNVEACRFIVFYILNEITEFSNFYEEMLLFFKSLGHFKEMTDCKTNVNKIKKRRFIEFYKGDKRYAKGYVDNVKYFKDYQLKKYWTICIHLDSNKIWL